MPLQVYSNLNDGCLAPRLKQTRTQGGTGVRRDVFLTVNTWEAHFGMLPTTWEGDEEVGD